MWCVEGWSVDCYNAGISNWFSLYFCICWKFDGRLTAFLVIFVMQHLKHWMKIDQDTLVIWIVGRWEWPCFMLLEGTIPLTSTQMLAAAKLFQESKQTTGHLIQANGNVFQSLLVTSFPTWWTPILRWASVQRIIDIILSAARLWMFHVLFWLLMIASDRCSSLQTRYSMRDVLNHPWINGC